MYKQHLSEKIAQVFVIADILLLIPGLLGMIPALIILLFGIISAQINVLLFGLIPILIFLIGIILFVGHLIHAGGDLAENKILPLWFGTLAYNGLPLFTTFLSFIANEDHRVLLTGENNSPNFQVILLASFGWLIVATCLSLTAIYDRFITGKIKC